MTMKGVKLVKNNTYKTETLVTYKNSIKNYSNIEKKNLYLIMLKIKK